MRWFLSAFSSQNTHVRLVDFALVDSVLTQACYVVVDYKKTATRFPASCRESQCLPDAIGCRLLCFGADPFFWTGQVIEQFVDRKQEQDHADDNERP